jgi:hypothetical protein
MQRKRETVSAFGAVDKGYDPAIKQSFEAIANRHDTALGRRRPAKSSSA